MFWSCLCQNARRCSFLRCFRFPKIQRPHRTFVSLHNDSVTQRHGVSGTFTEVVTLHCSCDSGCFFFMGLKGLWRENRGYRKDRLKYLICPLSILVASLWRHKKRQTFGATTIWTSELVNTLDLFLVFLWGFRLISPHTPGSLLCPKTCRLVLV